MDLGRLQGQVDVAKPVTVDVVSELERTAPDEVAAAVEREQTVDA